MTPRIDPAERRSEIIRAAMRCFARTGYHGTSMDDIVAESGLSKGTLYWHFENKQALFMGMMEAFLADMGAALQRVIEQEGPASERLQALARLFWKMAVEDAGFAELMMEAYAESSRDETINQFIRDLYQPYVDMLAGLIKQGIANGEFRPVPSMAVASAIAAMFDGLWFQAMIGIPVEDYTDADDLFDWMLRGLLPR